MTLSQDTVAHTANPEPLGLNRLPHRETLIPSPCTSLKPPPSEAVVHRKATKMTRNSTFGRPIYHDAGPLGFGHSVRGGLLWVYSEASRVEGLGFRV